MSNNAHIEMVFLDIDGTLYSDGEIVRSAANAVEQLLANDVPVALCTGRSVLHAQHIQEALQVPYGIFFNGGLVKSENQALYSAPFHLEDVKSIVQFAGENGISTIVHTMNRSITLPGVARRFETILNEFDFPDIDVVTTPDELFTDNRIFQINGFMTPDWDKEFEQRFPACYIYRWDDEACDFQRRKSDKSTGALHLLEHLGIHPENAVHIGDGGNDVGMFRALGWSYAMGNATDDVKQVAKRVTSNALDGGVALALRELGLI